MGPIKHRFTLGLMDARNRRKPHGGQEQAKLHTGQEPTKAPPFQEHTDPAQTKNKLWI